MRKHRTYLRLYPAALEGVVDDGALDVLDGDGRLGDAQHAGALARRGAHATRELCNFHTNQLSP